MTTPVIRLKGRKLTTRRSSKHVFENMDNYLRAPVRISSGITCKSCETPIDMNGSCLCSN